MTEHTGIETLFDDRYSYYSYCSYTYCMVLLSLVFFFGGWNGKDQSALVKFEIRFLLLFSK